MGKKVQHGYYNNVFLVQGEQGVQGIQGEIGNSGNPVMSYFGFKIFEMELLSLVFINLAILQQNRVNDHFLIRCMRFLFSLKFLLLLYVLSLYILPYLWTPPFISKNKELSNYQF